MSHILTLACPNRPGIVAAISTAIFAEHGNIAAAHQLDDPETGRFFGRIRITFAGEDRAAALRCRLAPIAAELGMTLSLRARAERSRVLILVSRFDHCLVDLLYRQRIGELDMQVVGVVSNHPRAAYAHLDLDGIAFHHLPVTPQTKPEQEAALLALASETGVDLVILARYMQILSDEMSAALAGKCINIHHSFLPGFKGARPYHQAHARGVKLIGATAHYVTADLDEGPIIAQDVEPISHADTAEMLVAKGRDIERRVLARAVAAHLDGRVLVNGHKTVVFGD